MLEITCRGSNVNSPGAGVCVVRCELTDWDVIVSVDDWYISVFVLDIICEDNEGAEGNEELEETIVLVDMVVCPVDSDELGTDVLEGYDIVVVVCEEDSVEDVLFECALVNKNVGIVDDTSKFELEWDMDVADTREFEEVNVSSVDDDGDVVSSDVPLPVDMKEEVDVSTSAVELTDDDILEISVLVPIKDEELLITEVIEGDGIDNKVVREAAIVECVCDKSSVVELVEDDCVGIPVDDSDVVCVGVNVGETVVVE